MTAPRASRSRAYVPNPPKNPHRVGAVQRAARRELIASGGKPVTTTAIMRRAYPRLTVFPNWLNAKRESLPLGLPSAPGGRPRGAEGRICGR
jgi:hypothetical protein